jgi:hypothetical protein
LLKIGQKFQIVYDCFQPYFSLCTEKHGQTYMCPTEEKSDVSGPIRSIKMCNCVQCVMQRKPVCWRAMTCLAQMEQGPVPLHPGHLPPPFVWSLGTQSASSFHTRMDLDSVADNRGQPIPESATTGQCMHILFFISHLVILSFGTFPQMVYLYSTDRCYIFRFD